MKIKLPSSYFKDLHIMMHFMYVREEGQPEEAGTPVFVDLFDGNPFDDEADNYPQFYMAKNLKMVCSSYCCIKFGISWSHSTSVWKEINVGKKVMTCSQGQQLSGSHGSCRGNCKGAMSNVCHGRGMHLAISFGVEKICGSRSLLLAYPLTYANGLASQIKDTD